MKKIYLLILILICTIALRAQTSNLAWANQYGNNGVTDGTILAVDDFGNSYMSGTYGSSGITLGAFNLSGAGGESVFLAKFSIGGVVLWAKRLTKIGGSQDEVNTEKIAIDSLGNVYYAGYYLAGATIDGVALSGNYNYFLTKFDSSGVVGWTKTSSSPSIIGFPFNSIHVDNQNNLCMVGLYEASITFDTSNTLTAFGGATVGSQAFIVKYNTAGNIVFANNMGGVNPSNPITNGNLATEDMFQFDQNDNIYRFEDTLFTKFNQTGIQLFQHTIKADSSFFKITSFAVDLLGNILFSAYFQNGPLVFMGDTINSAVQSSCIDAIIIKLDSNGTKKWIYQYIPTGTGFCSNTYVKVRVDGLGNSYAIGNEGNPSFQNRIMLLKLNALGSVLWDESFYSSNPPIYSQFGGILPHNIVQAHNGGNILAIGSFKQYIQFSPTINFIAPTNVWRMFIAQYGTCTNTTVPTITNAASSFCQGDSLLLIASPSSSYLWNTGDTTQSIYVNNTGNYYVFGIENNQCYVQSSTIHIDMLASPNLNITQNSTTLTAHQNGATYQWIDCISNFAIAGATNQSYTATANGNYAVVITNTNGCSDTSACIAITTVGINENNLQNVISISPNPVKDFLNINIIINKNLQVKKLIIKNSIGETVYTHDKNYLQTNIAQLATGVYTVELITDKGNWIGKFVKQ